MLSKKVWAVLGATPNKAKAGNTIVHKLIDNGYDVFCVNPNYDEIDGIKCYHSIDELPTVPDVIDVVVPPKVIRSMLDKIDSSQIKYLWFQPGSYNDEIIGLAREKGFSIVADGACVLVELSSK